MNVILVMSKALYQTGMAAPQAERENKGPPLSDIDEVVIFDFLRRNELSEIGWKLNGKEQHQ